MPVTSPRNGTPVSNDFKIRLITNDGDLIVEMNVNLCRLPYDVLKSTGRDFTEVLLAGQ